MNDDARPFDGEVVRDGLAGDRSEDPGGVVAERDRRRRGSAREVARLSGGYDACPWICGGVSVRHHTRSDFRMGHAAALDDLMTRCWPTCGP